MKYAWIASNKAHWPITLACEVLEVSASGYFEHGRRKKLPKPSKPGSHKRVSDEALLTLLQNRLWHKRRIHPQIYRPAAKLWATVSTDGFLSDFCEWYRRCSP
ncbi:hypothetical protein HUU62_07985 [Rhodoferax sp. 4810]|nr:hypothetical protein [Rhodoferax jenense]